MLSSTFWHVLAECILLVAHAKTCSKVLLLLLYWCSPVISLTKESTFEHVLAEAALLDWSAPGLNDLFENKNEFYFQHGGDPSHFHVDVRNFLHRTFNQRWTGRRGSPTEFPPRSPDLTPLGIYFCGTIKNSV